MNDAKEEIKALYLINRLNVGFYPMTLKKKQLTMNEGVKRLVLLLTEPTFGNSSLESMIQ